MWTVFFVCVAIGLAVPACVLGAECLLALLPVRRSKYQQLERSPSLAVLVPAHNEETLIASTVLAIREQLKPGDRLIVIADNCNDGTSAIAMKHGATVWERADASHRGKGYAIRFALERLRDVPPDIVVCIDADCLPASGCVDRIASTAFQFGRPVQAAYRMHPPKDATEMTHVSAFAVLVKNFVRHRGLQRLGTPCLITGSGVAYPWSVLNRVPHPSAHIVEDMAYSIDLALAGYPPKPCVEARIDSLLPTGKDSASTQRTRWEHGHFSVILSQGPKLLLGLLRRPSFGLTALMLDLIVPPLSILVMAIATGLAVFLVLGWLAGVWAPFYVLLAGAIVGAVGLACAWWRFGRGVLPARMLWRIPLYLLSKAPIYWNFLFNRQRAWVRTGRGASAPAADALAGPHFDSASEVVKSTSPK